MQSLMLHEDKLLKKKHKLKESRVSYYSNRLCLKNQKPIICVMFS